MALEEMGVAVLAGAYNIESEEVQRRERCNFFGRNGDNVVCQRTEPVVDGELIMDDEWRALSETELPIQRAGRLSNRHEKARLRSSRALAPP